MTFDEARELVLRHFHVHPTTLTQSELSIFDEFARAEVAAGATLASLEYRLTHGVNNNVMHAIGRVVRARTIRPG
jgi:hypothetical protein